MCRYRRLLQNTSAHRYEHGPNKDHFILSHYNRQINIILSLVTSMMMVSCWPKKITQFFNSLTSNYSLFFSLAPGTSNRDYTVWTLNPMSLRLNPGETFYYRQVCNHPILCRCLHITSHHIYFLSQSNTTRVQLHHRRVPHRLYCLFQCITP